MDYPDRNRQDTSPPILPSEDLSGVFEAPAGFGDNSIVGTIVAGRYTVTQMIGSGGMGCVYQAFDAAAQRDVALKVLKSDRIDSDSNVQRFLQEAQVLSMLSHPNVVQLVDFGQDENGVIYLAMELLQGTDLADYLSEVHHLPWEEVSEIALQLVRGLQVAHQRGIIHRDLKPENVYLVPGRRGGPHQVKVLDFGIAKVLTTHHSKLTTEGSVFGTARYMSPEQSSGEPVDARSDVYGVGILIYEMLTGRPPFTGDDFMRTAHQHVSEPPPPFALAAPEQVFLPNVEELVMRALAKSKQDRFSSMADFEAAILATQFDSDSTMAVVLPSPTAGGGGDDGFEQTRIKSLDELLPPSGSPRIPPPSAKPRVPSPIAASRGARQAPPPARPPPRPPSLDPVMPPPVETGFEQTIIKSAPGLPPMDAGVEQTVIKSAPIGPAHVEVERTRAISRDGLPPPPANILPQRDEPKAVGGTMVIQSPMAPSLPEFDDDERTRVNAPPPLMPPAGGAPMAGAAAGGGMGHGMAAGADPFPALPPPSIDDMGGPPPPVPPPAMPTPSAAAPPRPSAPPPFAMPSSGPPAAAPGRGFVAPAPAGTFSPSSPFGKPPTRDDASPVFAREQNENWMAAGLAPQRFSAGAGNNSNNNKNLNPEDALRAQFVGGKWVETEEAAATPAHDEFNDGGEFYLQPPVRETSRNLVVAIVIISMLALAAIAFVLWTMFRDGPDGTDEPHPATMAGQPKPTMFEPIVPEGPKFPEPLPEDDDFEPEPEPKTFKRTAKAVPETLSKKQISDGFGKARAAIDACARTHGAIAGTSVRISFDVVDRRARDCKAQPPHNLTPLGKCVAAAVDTHARFAESKLPSLSISRKVSF